jgi:hypothetical protein
VPKDQDDDRVSLAPLDPVDALKALLAVDPSGPPVDEAGRCPETSMDKPCRLAAGHYGPCQFDAG